ncbi:MAG TPA: outer membrane protein assembly factor BamD [Bryobacteraceae bacterium]|jgi:outer membrane protein assembly factor BamD|nr:outer membrane protein assembly factor BamD [Bryobacteraceae bacterium]
MQRRYHIFAVFVGVYAFVFLSGFGLFHHKKYETPITKETLQPDKILFDKAIHNIERGDYEAARLTLNTLINTYDTSEYLAKAKLAIADSWFREGGPHGLAQAEAEYKDFILFYPNMEEAAESQFKICNIHFKQMEKADRDNSQGQRAEDECRQVMVQFPNAKFVPQAQQMLRDVQEVLADKEFRTGLFYHTKGSFPAASNRLSFVSQQYPLYSGADEALWLNADSFRHMGDRFENQEADALSRIVRDYPLSVHLTAAKERLTAMKRPVPQADPAAYARMKYDLENRTRPGIVHRLISPFESKPDVNLAAKTGAPAMQALRPAVPVSVPASAAGGQTSAGPGGVSDVTAAVANSDEIDRAPEARLGNPNGGSASLTANGEGEQKAGVGTTAPASTDSKTPATTTNPTVNLPTNHPPTKDQIKAYNRQVKRAQEAQKKAAAKAAKEGKPAPATTPAAADSTTATTPAGATPAATIPAAKPQ